MKTGITKESIVYIKKVMKERIEKIRNELIHFDNDEYPTGSRQILVKELRRSAQVLRELQEI